MTDFKTNDFWRAGKRYISTNRYKSCVVYNNEVYICVTSHRSNEVFDESKFIKTPNDISVNESINDNLSNRYVAIDTYENILLNYNASEHQTKSAYAIDIGVRGAVLISNGVNWHPINPVTVFTNDKWYIVLGGSGATYIKTGNLVTVTSNSHGFPISDLNGADIYLTSGTGLLTSGTYTNFQYIDANTFSCVASYNNDTTGDLGTNTSETMSSISYTFPTELLKPYDTFVVSSYIRSKITGNIKTTRFYFNDKLFASASQSGNPTIASVNAQNVAILPNNKCIFNGTASTVNYTDGNCNFSALLTNSLDWVAVLTNRILFTPGA